MCCCCCCCWRLLAASKTLVLLLVDVSSASKASCCRITCVGLLHAASICKHSNSNVRRWQNRAQWAALTKRVSSDAQAGCGDGVAVKTDGPAHKHIHTHAALNTAHRHTCYITHACLKASYHGLMELLAAASKVVLVPVER